MDIQNEKKSLVRLHFVFAHRLSLHDGQSLSPKYECKNGT